MNDETGEAVRQWRAKARSDWTTVEILLHRQGARDGWGPGFAIALAI